MTNIKNFVLSDTFYYNEIPVLTYQIDYPQFAGPNIPFPLLKINANYTALAHKFELYIINELTPSAIEGWKYAKENEFPFFPYEALLSYTITYQTACTLSLYYDQYTFTGGAHGNTIRQSDTWNLKTGCPVALSCFYLHVPELKEELIRFITGQISKSPDSQSFFDDYGQLVLESFREQSFYLKPEGIVLYFQHYEIAPYSSGIPEFLHSYCS